MEMQKQHLPILHLGILYYCRWETFITLYQVRDPHGLTRIAKGTSYKQYKLKKCKEED